MVASKTEYLTTDQLSVGYSAPRGTRTLFENLDLRLPSGMVICFMGPNGIGKSSLIRTLAGLQRPLSGNVRMAGGNDPSKQVAVVLTDRISAPNMTVYDVVAYGRYPYLNWNLSMNEKDHTQVEQAIDRVQIGHLRDERVYTLSDGQLQMVMISRALAQDTPVILLDEPTAHLDLNNRVEIMKLLKHLAATTNRSVLVATHELDLALQLADQIWVAGTNKDIITGIPEDLVLGGTFDSIFQLKGYDLKTGKVRHEINKATTVQLTGEGYEYLWTKNAIERNGYAVVGEGGAVQIHIERNGEEIRWHANEAGHQRQFKTIGELIDSL